MLLKCRTLFTSSTSDLKRKAVTSRIPVEVCQVDIVYHRLMEHWQAHLLAQLGSQSGLSGSCKAGHSIHIMQQSRDALGRAHQ